MKKRVYKIMFLFSARNLPKIELEHFPKLFGYILFLISVYSLISYFDLFLKSVQNFNLLLYFKLLFRFLELTRRLKNRINLYYKGTILAGTKNIFVR